MDLLSLKFLTRLVVLSISRSNTIAVPTGPGTSNMVLQVPGTSQYLAQELHASLFWSAEFQIA
jgi:hypothetical protein